MGAKKLAGLRVAALVADGFEQVELTEPRKALESAGAIVEIISPHAGKIQGMNLLVPGKKTHVDYMLRDAEPGRYDALMLPGGFVNPDLLRQEAAALEFVRAFERDGKPIAVICHGPWLLVSAGLVSGRRLTSWPGIKDDIINAGGAWEDQAIVRDRNWVSSRGPQDIAAFTKATIDLFAHKTLQEARNPEPRSRKSARWLTGGAFAAGLGYAAWRFAAGRSRATT